MLSKIFGVLLIIGGVVLGLWLGLWVMFVGGIVDVVVEVVDAINGTNALEGLVLAWGIIKIMLAGLVGWLSFYICFFIGGAMLTSSYSRPYKLRRR